MRYHRDIHYREEHLKQIDEFSKLFNEKATFEMTTHGIDRIIDKLGIDGLTFLKDCITFNSNDVFEYYVDGTGRVHKICYRINYNDLQDLIIVLTDRKEIVTVYLNNKNDMHKTLDKRNYALC